MKEPINLHHGRVSLALHCLSGGADDSDSNSLLMLHELRASAESLVVPQEWIGPVWGLDFTGHGLSESPPGGGAAPEILLGDVDAALGYLGPCTLLGEGLGAYIALLAAAALPDQVLGAILAPGEGLDGGGPDPQPLSENRALKQIGLSGSDLLQAELSMDVRPPGYADLLVRQVIHLGETDPGLFVATGSADGPPWLGAVRAHVEVVSGTVADGLRSYGHGMRNGA